MISNCNRWRAKFLQNGKISPLPLPLWHQNIIEGRRRESASQQKEFTLPPPPSHHRGKREELSNKRQANCKILHHNFLFWPLISSPEIDGCADEKFCVLMKFNHRRAHEDPLINEQSVSPKINYFSLQVFCVVFFSSVRVYISANFSFSFCLSCEGFGGK